MKKKHVIFLLVLIGQIFGGSVSAMRRHYMFMPSVGDRGFRPEARVISKNNEILHRAIKSVEGFYRAKRVDEHRDKSCVDMLNEQIDYDVVCGYMMNRLFDEFPTEDLVKMVVAQQDEDERERPFIVFQIPDAVCERSRKIMYSRERAIFRLRMILRRADVVAAALDAERAAHKAKRRKKFLFYYSQ